MYAYMYVDRILEQQTWIKWIIGRTSPDHNGEYMLKVSQGPASGIILIWGSNGYRLVGP